MEIILSQKPKTRGSINISASLNTMEVGERWSLSTTTVSHASLRAICAAIGPKANKIYSVTHTAEMGEMMIVTRTK